MSPITIVGTIVTVSILLALGGAYATRRRQHWKNIRCADCGKVVPFRDGIEIPEIGEQFCRKHGRGYREVLHIGPFNRRSK
jgi:Fe2+ or Zn2+ uptake regulation protein